MSLWRSLLGRNSTNNEQGTAKTFRNMAASPRATDPKQATAIAFDEALKLAKRLPVNEVYRPFNEVVRPWARNVSIGDPYRRYAVWCWTI